MGFVSDRQRRAVFAKMKGKKPHPGWFRQAVYRRPPNTLGGWHKTSPPAIRRRRAMQSCPANWSPARKHLRCAQALQALANVTTDRSTKAAARADSMHFYSLYHRGHPDR